MAWLTARIARSQGTGAYFNCLCEHGVTGFGGSGSSGSGTTTT